MHSSLDTQFIIDTIDIITDLTDPVWIAITGSASNKAENFSPESDIDVLVIHETESRNMMCELSGRTLDIIQCARPKIDMICNNPHWFGARWVWEVGKLKHAEGIAGKRPRIDVKPKSRLIAMVACIGNVVRIRDKHDQGRPNENDEDFELTALKCVVDKIFPISRTYKTDLIDLDYADKTRPIFEPLLCFELENILFYAEHRRGIEYLNDRWNLGLNIPVMGTLHT